MSEVKLLPLPSERMIHPERWGDESWGYTAEQMEAYARANMEPLIAEIERLRAEVEDAYAAADSKAGWEWKKRAEAAEANTEALRAEVTEARDGWHMANGTAGLAMKHRDVAEARAERLAEALREIEGCNSSCGQLMRDVARAALHPTAAQENDDA